MRCDLVPARQHRLAYALILWGGGMLLAGQVYYEVSTYLQYLSPELGVWFLPLSRFLPTGG